MKESDPRKHSDAYESLKRNYFSAKEFTSYDCLCLIREILEACRTFFEWITKKERDFKPIDKFLNYLLEESTRERRITSEEIMTKMGIPLYPNETFCLLEKKTESIRNGNFLERSVFLSSRGLLFFLHVVFRKESLTEEISDINGYNEVVRIVTGIHDEGNKTDEFERHALPVFSSEGLRRVFGILDNFWREIERKKGRLSKAEKAWGEIKKIEEEISL